jgi:hypothetical protein
MMLKSLNRKLLVIQAAGVTGMLVGAAPAQAQTVIGGTNNDWSTIAQNISNSIALLPGMLSGIAYMMGMLFGALGVLKMKDHVENPTQTPLKDGAIRMASGGALFALPMVFEAMRNTIGTTGNEVQAATLHRVDFKVN